MSRPEPPHRLHGGIGVLLVAGQRPRTRREGSGPCRQGSAAVLSASCSDFSIPSRRWKFLSTPSEVTEMISFFFSSLSNPPSTVLPISSNCRILAWICWRASLLAERVSSFRSTSRESAMIFLNSPSISSIRRFSERNRVSFVETSSAVFFVRASCSSSSATSGRAALSWAISFFISSMGASRPAFMESARSNRRVCEVKLLTRLSISPRFTERRR